MENILFRIILKNKKTIDVNIDGVSDLEEAKREVNESILAGDIKLDGVSIKQSDVARVVDIPG